MLALSALLFSSAHAMDDGMVITPFGRRLRQCVIEVESGSHIYEHGDNLRITQEREDGVVLSSWDYLVPSECHTDGFVEFQREKMRQKRNRKSNPVPDGWLDNAGAYPLGQSGNISRFDGVYTVPGDPAADNGQVLFYFIGMQDNNYAAVNILQPVLTWGNGIKGWNSLLGIAAPRTSPFNPNPLLVLVLVIKFVGLLFAKTLRLGLSMPLL
jgi:hypothetical protein